MISKYNCISISKDHFDITNSEDPVKCRNMRNFIWVFTVCQNLHLGVTSLQRVKRSCYLKYWPYQVLVLSSIGFSFFMSLSSIGLVLFHVLITGPYSAVGNVSDCRFRGHEFDPGPVPYFHGD